MGWGLGACWGVLGGAVRGGSVGGGCGGEGTGVGAGWWGRVGSGSVSDRRHLLARALSGDRRVVVRDAIRRRGGSVGCFMLVAGSQVHTPTVILCRKLFWRVSCGGWSWEGSRHPGMRSTWSVPSPSIFCAERGWMGLDMAR